MNHRFAHPNLGIFRMKRLILHCISYDIDQSHRTVRDAPEQISMSGPGWGYMVPEV